MVLATGLKPMVKYVYFDIHTEHTFFTYFFLSLSLPPTTNGAKHGMKITHIEDKLSTGTIHTCILKPVSKIHLRCGGGEGIETPEGTRDDPL